LGYRKTESNDAPTGYKSASAMNDDDVYPISIFGEEKPIPNNKLGRYINSDFFYYNGIYENNKRFGFPYKDWFDAPHWVLELHELFENTDKEYEIHLMNKGHQTK